MVMKLISFKSCKSAYILGVFLLIIVSCGSGSNDDDGFDYSGTEVEDIIPTDLTLAITIVGSDTDNPNGDGTGVVQFKATASKAVKYLFKIDNETEQESTSGSVEHTFIKEGTSNYNITVTAFSSTGNSINTTKTITVFHEVQLIWSDEFNTDGSPDATKWGYNIGTGSYGWGNGEKQYYTDRSENVIVEGGFLKITAKKESYNGSQYTSTRMLTEGKFDFTYGKVEVRAKLPIGEGTWPAIWMLGSNLSDVSWPACGEIDIMEHWGHNHGVVQSALHTPSSYGNTQNHGAQTLEDVSTAFHVYEVNWTADEIVFSVDGKQHYRYAPASKNDENWPYYAKQFLILNVAMGGSWFDIDPDFVESTMEIDYVRIYQ